MVEIERGKNSVQKSLWKILWTCRKTECGITILYLSDENHRTHFVLSLLQSDLRALKSSALLQAVLCRLASASACNQP